MFNLTEEEIVQKVHDKGYRLGSGWKNALERTSEELELKKITLTFDDILSRAIQYTRPQKTIKPTDILRIAKLKD